VLSVNETLNTRPEIVNESPEEAAWMATMKMTDPSEVAKLMSRKQYDEYRKGL
jgi:glycine cleavage system H protein